MADTDWLNDTSSASATADSLEDWLRVEDANANSTTAPFHHLVQACMRGTDRVMACDGQYLAYRPYNRELDKTTNPRTKERFQMFMEKGYYKHVGTFDEVQLYELLPGNPYRHEQKQYVIGQDYWKDIRKAAQAACNRAWSDYHDILGAMATALKGGGRTSEFARTMFLDAVNHVGIAIQQMRGPSEKEVNEGFLEVRRARGITGRTGMVLLNSNTLQKVGFEKGK